jgi:hypothetical protein
MLLVVTPEINKFFRVHREGAFNLSIVPEDNTSKMLYKARFAGHS